MKAWKYWEILVLLSKESPAGGKTRRRGDKLPSDRAILSGLLSKDATYNQGGLFPSIKAIRTLLRMIVPSQVSLICGRMMFKPNIITGGTGCHSYLQGDPLVSWKWGCSRQMKHGLPTAWKENGSFWPAPLWKDIAPLTRHTAG